MEVLSIAAREGKQYLEDLARLRITVFAEWPYLYAGDLDYEKKYLKRFFKAKDSVLVLALDAGRVVGAATGLPLVREMASLKAPFVAAGYDLRSIFYFSESILLPEYRGRGIGVRFFEHREAWAWSHGYTQTVFCRVVRSAGHPLRPAGYVPLDAFWEKRGYRPLGENMVGYIAWQDHDEEEERLKPLAFWGHIKG